MHWYYKIACIVITNWHLVTAVGGCLATQETGSKQYSQIHWQGRMVSGIKTTIPILLPAQLLYTVCKETRIVLFR